MIHFVLINVLSDILDMLILTVQYSARNAHFHVFNAKTHQALVQIALQAIY
jgi:hypothetical protein